MDNVKFNMEKFKNILKDFGNINSMFEDLRMHDFFICNGFVLSNGVYSNSFYNDQLRRIIFVEVKPYKDNGIHVKLESASGSYTYENDYQYNFDCVSINENIGKALSDSLVEAAIEFAKICTGENNENE